MARSKLRIAPYSSCANVVAPTEHFFFCLGEYPDSGVGSEPEREGARDEAADDDSDNETSPPSRPSLPSEDALSLNGAGYFVSCFC